MKTTLTLTDHSNVVLGQWVNILPTQLTLEKLVDDYQMSMVADPPGESVQLVALKAHWSANRYQIGKMIIAQAKNWLATKRYNESGGSSDQWEYYRGDGMIDPFLQGDNNYAQLIANEGNADDEEQRISDLWVMLLSQTDDPKFCPLIAEIAATNIYGL